MQEGNEEPFNIRLHLAKDILTIQEQDVICVSGEPFYSSVSNIVLIIITNCICLYIEMSYICCTIHERYLTQILRDTLNDCFYDKSTSLNLFLIHQCSY